MPTIPKKKATVTDIAIRLFISDMLDRGQIKLAKFALVLGYKDSTELFKFIKSERNYSRPRLQSTINTLIEIYGANKTFLETGHGSMYAGKPYMNEEEPPAFNDHGNIATYSSQQRIKELEEAFKKLQDRNKQLEELLKAKDEIIALQKKIIENPKKPK